jgi:hypothetical protein
LGGEFGEIDVVDVHFLLLDEIEKQIERSFEDLKLNFVFGHELAESLNRAQDVCNEGTEMKAQFVTKI